MNSARTLCKLRWLIGAVILGFGICANATLIDRGNGLIYDDDLDVTWLQDANLAASNTFGVSSIGADGSMDWDTATAPNGWIAAMNADGGTGYLGFSDWRLPTTLQPDPTCSDQLPGTPPQGRGFNCTGSEMGHLFYDELGGTAGDDLQSGSTPVPFFFNIGVGYWSGTQSFFPPDAWQFAFFEGIQESFGKIEPQLAWPVRPGDSMAGAVPEPTTLLLLGLGLAGLGFARKRLH